MGIRDRDYMKRPSDDDGPHNSSSDSNAEEFARGFLEKHPRFFLYVSISVGVLIVAAVIISKFSQARR